MEFPQNKSEEELLEQIKSIKSYHSEHPRLSTLKDDDSHHINASAVGSEILKTRGSPRTEKT